jgi:hypothetical protein
MVIDELSGTTLRREITELVERSVDEGGGLDADVVRWTAFRIAEEVDWLVEKVGFPWLGPLPRPSTWE